jgi:hypothetical protein
MDKKRGKRGGGVEGGIRKIKYGVEGEGREEG